jgi:hypothetical protein
MNREVHVRFCEGLGVKFPGPTRQIRPLRGAAENGRCTSSREGLALAASHRGPNRVRMSKPADCKIDELLAAHHGGEIDGMERAHPSSGCADEFKGLLSSVGICIATGNSGVLRSETCRWRAPHAAPGTSDDADLAVQSHFMILQLRFSFGCDRVAKSAFEIRRSCTALRRRPALDRSRKPRPRW